MRSKRQTTMAKLQRERKVQERRELKREKKQAAAAARKAEREGLELDTESVESAEEQSGDLSATVRDD